MSEESIEEMQARHEREAAALQTRIASKKRNASKKTRRGVLDECARLERELREVHGEEVARRGGGEQDEGTMPGDVTTADDVPGDDSPENIKAAAPEDDSSKDMKAALGTDDDQNDNKAPGTDDTSMPRKRNRQRERLARRAASQAAAVEAAAEEASHMANPAAHEAQAMRAAIAARGLVQVDIAPDGHCLFSAVADQLQHRDMALVPDASSSASSSESCQLPPSSSSSSKLPPSSSASSKDPPSPSTSVSNSSSASSKPPTSSSTEPPYKTVRRAAAQYMLDHAPDFAPFIDDDLAVYAARMRDSAEWGGHVELLALARCYKTQICVLHEGRVERVGDEQHGGADDKALWLAYYRHGFGLGEHYNSLRSNTTKTSMS